MNQPGVEQLKDGRCDCPLPVRFWLYVDESDTEAPNVPYCQECLRQILASDAVAFYMANTDDYGIAVRNQPVEPAKV